MGVFLLVVIAIVGMITLSIHFSNKKYQKFLKERQEWLDSENQKPKFGLKILTTSSELLTTKPYEPYDDGFDHKFAIRQTSRQVAEFRANNVMKNGLHFGNEFYPPGVIAKITIYEEVVDKQ